MHDAIYPALVFNRLGFISLLDGAPPENQLYLLSAFGGRMECGWNKYAIYFKEAKMRKVGEKKCAIVMIEER